MASLCSTDVLTGQEGTLVFRPPGTSVCVRDFSPFGYDATKTRIKLECGADFRVNDEIVFTEEDGGNLDGDWLKTLRVICVWLNFKPW